MPYQQCQSTESNSAEPWRNRILKISQQWKTVTDNSTLAHFLFHSGQLLHHSVHMTGINVIKKYLPADNEKNHIPVLKLA